MRRQPADQVVHLHDHKAEGDPPRLSRLGRRLVHHGRDGRDTEPGRFAQLRATQGVLRYEHHRCEARIKHRRTLCRMPRIKSAAFPPRRDATPCPDWSVPDPASPSTLAMASIVPGSKGGYALTLQSPPSGRRFPPAGVAGPSALSAVTWCFRRSRRLWALWRSAGCIRLWCGSSPCT